MSDRLEAFLAKLYTDEALRAWFLADPCGVAARAGFDAESCRALARIDRAGLELHSAGLVAKRRVPKPRARPRLYDRAWAMLARRASAPRSR